MKMHRGLAFDLETAPLAESLKLPVPQDWLLATVRSNFRPETAEKYKAIQVKAWPAEIAKRAALDWRLGQITAIGFGWRGLKGAFHREIADGLAQTTAATVWQRLRDERGLQVSAWPGG